MPFFLLSDESDGLQTLLGFVKGLDTIPSLGFDERPRLKFYHPNPVDEYDGYANILTVPVFMSDYDLFYEIHSSAASFYCVFTNA